MASTALKTIVATGASSGLGFEAIRQLLVQSQTQYNIVLGARSPSRVRAALTDLDLKVDIDPKSAPAETPAGRHAVTVLPLELADLRSTRAFAHQTLAQLPRIDYLMLNAAVAQGAEGGAGKWCEALMVNHFSQHYLMHLFREKLVESQTRVVFVSSGAIRNVPDPKTLDTHLVANADTNGTITYCETKFAQLLSAHWWRRNLSSTGATVVAVSPGLIPGTGLGIPRTDDSDAQKGPSALSGLGIPANHPDAKSIPEGAASMLRALFVARDDFPQDPQQLFLTSWGEWWPTDVYANSLDQALQDKWSPSKEQIERDAGETGEA